MAYTAGLPAPAQGFSAAGPRINQNMAGFTQAMDDEKLREFYAALAARQGGGAVGGGYDAQGNLLAPQGLQGIEPPQLSRQYVKNAGVNLLLNKLIKPGASGAGGLGGGGKAAALLGSL